MATKQQVAAAASRAGFKFEADENSVFIACPEGFAFCDQSYGESYSEWPVGRGEEFTKSYAYGCCMEIIKAGMERVDE